jgi:hypothetical protein
MSRLKKRAKINVPFLQQEMSIWDKKESFFTRPIYKD